MIKADKDKKLLHCDLTDKILACAYEVYNQLGFGFSEKIYENAMMIKLSQRGLSAVQQAPANVFLKTTLLESTILISL